MSVVSGRRLLSLAGVLLIAGSIAYVARPAGHVALYDANLVRLAESNLQGYCAGETYWATGGYGNAGKARECRSRLADKRPDDVRPAAVLGAFCAGVVHAGWGGTVAACVKEVSDEELWPTYDGSLSDQWNRARPYPLPKIAAGGKPSQPDSRTGNRQKQQRDEQEDQRGNRGYEEGVG